MIMNINRLSKPDLRTHNSSEEEFEDGLDKSKDKHHSTNNSMYD